MNALPALILAAVVLLITQAGYMAEDDAHYLFAADGWRAGWFLGTNHWHLRHPHVLAIAASFSLFGRSELSMMLPTMASYVGVILITTWLVRRIADDRAAAFAGVLVAVTPILAFYAKIPYPDVSELFYCTASFALLWKGLETQAWRWFVLSGLAMAMAWLIRSSSVPFVMLYGTLFLIGFRVPRARYLAMFAGFLPPVLIEWTYYFVRTGNPFYRFGVDMHSLEIPSAHMIGGVAHGLRPPFNPELMARWVPNSIVDVHWLINPYIDFLSNPVYGLLIWAGIAGAVVLLRDKGLAPSVRQFTWVIIALALLWIFVSIYVLNLRPQPRYFLPVCWSACMLAGMGLNRAFPTGRGAPAMAALAAMVLLDITLITARRDPMEAERQLVDYAAGHRGCFVTDLPKTPFLLQERGLENRVSIISTNAGTGNCTILTTVSLADRWKRRGDYRMELLPPAHDLTDRAWEALAPAAITDRLRPARDPALLRAPAVTAPANP